MGIREYVGTGMVSNSVSETGFLSLCFTKVLLNNYHSVSDLLRVIGSSVA